MSTNVKQIVWTSRPSGDEVDYDAGARDAKSDLAKCQTAHDLASWVENYRRLGLRALMAVMSEHYGITVNSVSKKSTAPAESAPATGDAHTIAALTLAYVRKDISKAEFERAVKSISG